jgi:hypothetical protein
VVTEDGANAHKQRGVLFVTDFRSKTGPEPEVQIIAKIPIRRFTIIEHCDPVLENSLVVGLHEREIYGFTICSASLLHPMRFKWKPDRLVHGNMFSPAGILLVSRPLPTRFISQFCSHPPSILHAGFQVVQWRLTADRSAASWSFRASGKSIPRANERFHRQSGAIDSSLQRETESPGRQA